jgi:chromosome segregation ATPase
VRRAFGQGADPERELERLLQDRRAELEEYAARFEETARELARREERLSDERASVERLIRRSTTELEAREKELVEFERELERRAERVAAAEEDVARRRGDLGAVELMRAALESRERALEAKEAVLADREAAAGALPAEHAGVAELLFVPGPEYRLVDAESRATAPGATLELDGGEYVVVRIGRSPLPRDARRCAYLERGAPREPGGGSR